MQSAMTWLKKQSKVEDLVLFLDFDGTLAPIVERPDDARPLDGIRELVELIAERIPVAIISGRGLDDVVKRLGAQGIYYAGSHGMEIQDREGQRHEADELKELLPELGQHEAWLRDWFSDLPEIEIERKRFGVAVHFRRAPTAGVEVEQALQRILERSPGLKIGTGKMVREVQPDVAQNKGTALRFIWDAIDKQRRRRPIFIGDDVTDEDAFEVIRDRGVGVLVARQGRSTAAELILESPKQVRQFLYCLVDKLDLELASSSE